MNAPWRQMTRITGQKKGSLENKKISPRPRLIQRPGDELPTGALGRRADQDPGLQATSWAWGNINSLTFTRYYPLYTRPGISVSLFNTKTQEHKTLFTTGAP